MNSIKTFPARKTKLWNSLLEGVARKTKPWALPRWSLIGLGGGLNDVAACHSKGQTLQPSQRCAALPEQHLPAEMLNDHILRAKPRTCLGAVMLEQPVWPSSLLSNIAEGGNSSILRERQSLLRKVWLALQGKSLHAITDRALIWARKFRISVLHCFWPLDWNTCACYPPHPLPR